MSSKSTATLGLNAVLGGGSKAVFLAISKGLKQISTEVKKTAKDLLKMGDATGANALGSLSMAMDRVVGSTEDLAKGTKKAAKEMTAATVPIKDMAKEVSAVQKAWKHYEDTSNKSGTTIKANSKRVVQLSSSIGELARRLTEAGGDGDKWAQSLTRRNAMLAQSKGLFKTTGDGIKDYSANSKKLLGITEEFEPAFKKMSKSQSDYNKGLLQAEKRSAKYQEAFESLGKSYGYHDDYTKRWTKSLNQTRNSMKEQVTSLAKVDKGMSALIRKSDLAAVAQQVIEGNIKATSKGFQILNEKGLKPFKKLSYSAAKDAGLLSKGFASLSVKEGVMSLTELGKAYQEADKRGKGFRKGLDDLSKSGVGVSTDLKTRVDHLKKLDNAHRKLTDTLQRDGKITVAEMQKRNQAFDANAYSIKKGSKALESLQGTLTATAKKATPLSKAITNMSVDTGLSTNAIRKYAGELIKTGTSVDRLVPELNKLKKEILSQERALTSSQKNRTKYTKQNLDQIKAEETASRGKITSVKKLQEAIKSSINTENELLKKQKAQATLRNQVRSSVQKLTAVYPDLIKNKKELATQVSNIRNAYKTSKAAGDVLTQSVIKQAKAFQKTEKPMNIFADGIRSVFKSIKSFASYAAGASIIAGFAMGLRSATTAIIEFDQALKDLQAITGATDREVQVMGDKILEVASKTKFSAEEVALGMKTLGQAGLSASESVRTMQAISDLATGTLTDMATSVDLVTTAMRVFQIDASDSGHVADVFANAVNKSKLTVEKLRIAMNYVGPVAARAGISFEEVASSMMVLANSGIRASTIGTGLRQVFRKLVDPSKKLKAGIKAAGLSLDDFNPKAHSMSQIIENLSEVVGSAEDAFQMFGMRGASAISALTAGGTSGFEAMYEAVNKSGSAANMASIQMEGLGVKIKNMWDLSKNFAIALGEAGLAKALHVVVDGTRAFLKVIIALAGNPISHLVMQIGAATVALALFIATVKALGSITGISTFFTTFTGFFSKIPATIAATNAGLHGTTIATTGAAGGFHKLAIGIRATTVAMIASGWGAVVVAIGLVIAATVTLFSLEKRRRRLLQEDIDKNRNLADTFMDLSSSVSRYNDKIIKAGDDTKKVSQINLDMRRKLTELTETSKDATKAEIKMAEAAKEAALAINPLTGEIKEGSTALAEYSQIIKELKVQSIATSFKLVAEQFDNAYSSLDRLKHTFKTWIQFGVEFSKKWNPVSMTLDLVKNSLELLSIVANKVSSPLGGIFDGILEKFPTIDKIFNSMLDTVNKVIAVSKEAAGLDYESKSTTGVDLYDDYKSGDRTAEDYQKLKDAANSSEKDVTKLLRLIHELDVEAKGTIEGLFRMGTIDISETSAGLLDAAEKAGYLKDATKEQINALTTLFAKMKEGEVSGASGIAERWAKNYKKAQEANKEFTIGVVNGSSDVMQAMSKLDSANIESFNKDKADIAARSAANKKAFADRLITEKEYHAKANALDKEARELQRKLNEDPELVKARDLKQVQEEFDKKMAINQNHYDEEQIQYSEYSKRMNDLEKQRAKKVKQIIAGTYDIEAMKFKLKEFEAAEKQALIESLRNIELASSGDREGTDDGVYDQQKLEAIVASHRKIEEEYRLHYEKLLKTHGKNDKNVQAIHKKYLDSIKIRQKSELSLIKNFVKDRDKAEDKVSDLSGDRNKEIEKHRIKETKIETDAAAKIVAINKSKNEKIKDLEEKRADITKQVNADIISIHESTEDKIAGINQRGMTDRQKERDNEKRAWQKLSKGKELLRKATASGDKVLAERAKKSIEDAGGLYESLGNDKKAINGLRRVEEALQSATAGIGDIGKKEIDDEISKEERKAVYKIKLVKDLAVNKQQAELKRHELEMKNLNLELAEWNKKLAVAKELLEVTRQKTMEDPTAEGITEKSTSSKSDVYQDDQGVWQQKSVDTMKPDSTLDRDIEKAQELEDAYQDLKEVAEVYGTTVGGMADNYAEEMLIKMADIKQRVENGEKIDIPFELGELEKLQEKYSEFANAAEGNPLGIDKETMGDDLQGVYTEFVGWMDAQDPASINVEVDKESLSAADAAIKKLAQTVVVKITTKAIGGEVGAISRAKGGRIPGPDSKKDNTLVHARTGEWFIRNESVKSWKDNVGSWFMNAVNAPMSSAGKTLMGMVKGAKQSELALATPNMSGLTKPRSNDTMSEMHEFGTVNLNLPNSDRSIPALMKSSDATELINQINKIGRLAS